MRAPGFAEASAEREGGRRPCSPYCPAGQIRHRSAVCHRGCDLRAAVFAYRIHFGERRGQAVRRELPHGQARAVQGGRRHWPRAVQLVLLIGAHAAHFGAYRAWRRDLPYRVCPEEPPDAFRENRYRGALVVALHCGWPVRIPVLRAANGLGFQHSVGRFGAHDVQPAHFGARYSAGARGYSQRPARRRLGARRKPLGDHHSRAASRGVACHYHGHHSVGGACVRRGCGAHLHGGPVGADARFHEPRFLERVVPVERVPPGRNARGSYLEDQQRRRGARP